MTSVDFVQIIFACSIEHNIERVSHFVEMERNVNIILSYTVHTVVMKDIRHA